MQIVYDGNSAGRTLPELHVFLIEDTAMRFATNRRVGLWLVVTALAATAALIAADPPHEQKTNEVPSRKAEHPTDQIATQSDLLAPRAALAQHRHQAEQAVRRALQTEITINFDERPLGEALQTLSERGEFPLWIDKDALRQELVEVDDPVSARLMNVSVNTALQRILTPLGLWWHIEDEVLKVTTGTEAYDKLEVETFDVRRLLELAEQARRYTEERQPLAVPDLTMGQFEAPWAKYGEREAWLVRLLHDVAPGDWFGSPHGGSAEILEDTLVVRQNWHDLSQIRELLSALEDAATGTLNHGYVTVYPTDYPVDADRAAWDALTSKVDVNFKDEPLRKVLDELADRHKVEFWVEHVALSEEGISADEPISLAHRNITLASLLKLMLDPLWLTCYVDRGALVVTTETEAAERYITRVYDVRDLLTAGVETRLLPEMIMSSTSSNWELVDGVSQGSVRAPFPGVLVVQQMFPDVLAEVDEILAGLRQTTLKHADRRAAELAAARSDVTTRVYAVGSAGPADEVIEALNTVVKPQAGQPPAEFTVRAVGETLVIRTSNTLHRDIRSFVNDLLTPEEPWEDSAYPGGGYF